MDERTVLICKLLQLLCDALIPGVEHVDVRLEDADVRSHLQPNSAVNAMRNA